MIWRLFCITQVDHQKPDNKENWCKINFIFGIKGFLFSLCINVEDGTFLYKRIGLVRAYSLVLKVMFSL
jgi:hypothetical protein